MGLFVCVHACVHVYMHYGYKSHITVHRSHLQEMSHWTPQLTRECDTPRAAGILQAVCNLLVSPGPHTFPTVHPSLFLSAARGKQRQ